MAVDFKKRVAGKKTKLAGKSLDDVAIATEIPIVEQYEPGNLYKIPISAISSDPNQPRKTFNEQTLNELAASIAKQGVLQPIIIRKNDNEDIDTEFILIAGERRFRASKIAKLEQIPVLFSNGDPEEIALIENLQRDDLKPIEEAEAYQRVIASHNYTHEQLSGVVGKSRTTISELLTLIDLPESVKEQCRTADTPKSVLLEIAKRKDHEEMIFLYEKVKNENLTVSKIRQLTRPRPTRRVRQVDQRAIEKIIEIKHLIKKLSSIGISPESKERLRSEVDSLNEALQDLLAK
jgi:ParB family transcriptional regulator, chromosome partitioning protein